MFEFSRSTHSGIPIPILFGFAYSWQQPFPDINDVKKLCKYGAWISRRGRQLIREVSILSMFTLEGSRK
jgi:hypothetical protein